MARRRGAIVVDLEKAREEKRQLQVEKVVVDRYNARLEAGWHPPQAQALGQLEYNPDVSRFMDDLRREVNSLHHQMEGIHREGERLDRAEAVLGERHRTDAELDRLRSPIHAVKRWFSDDARKGFVRAQDRLQGLDCSLKEIGTTSREQLKEQRAGWEEERAKVPAMQTKVAELSPAMDLASWALDGFYQAIQRARKREREYERGQDLGWER